MIFASCLIPDNRTIETFIIATFNISAVDPPIVRHFQSTGLCKIGINPPCERIEFVIQIIADARIPGVDDHLVKVDQSTILLFAI